MPVAMAVLAFVLMPVAMCMHFMSVFFLGHCGIQLEPGHAGPKLQDGELRELSGHVLQERFEALADGDKDAGRTDLHQVPRSEHIVVGAAGLGLDKQIYPDAGNAAGDLSGQEPGGIRGCQDFQSGGLGKRRRNGAGRKGKRKQRHDGAAAGQHGALLLRDRTAAGANSTRGVL